MTVTAKGWTDLDAQSPMLGPGQIDDAAHHAEDLTDQHVAAAANLPATGNWPARTMFTDDIGGVWRWFSNQWVMVSRVPTAWTTLSLASGWSNQATNPYPPLRWRIDQNGCLRLQGQVATRTGYGVTEAFATLPVGARPPVSIEVPVTGNGTNPRTFNSVLFNTNGTLNLYGPVTAAFNMGEPVLSLV